MCTVSANRQSVSIYPSPYFQTSETVRAKTESFCFCTENAHQCRVPVVWDTSVWLRDNRSQIWTFSFKFPIKNRAPVISSFTHFLPIFLQGPIDSARTSDATLRYSIIEGSRTCEESRQKDPETRPDRDTPRPWKESTYAQHKVVIR